MVENRKTKIVTGISGCKQYSVVVDVTDIAQKMFGVNIKLAYQLLGSFDRKEDIICAKYRTVYSDGLDSSLYVEFDDNHKVLFNLRHSSYESPYISVVK